MRLLAIDPSSTSIGAAVFEGETPVKWCVIKVRGANELKIKALRVAMSDLREFLGPAPSIDRCVVERPAAKAPAKKEHSAGQATYGMAVGYLLRELEEWPIDDIETVRADRWTRGKSKEARAARLQFEVPGYSPAGDSGMDAADAIELGLWFIANMREKQLRGEVTQPIDG